ncbi:MAG: hypothetical protein KDC46_15430 [Thermoleophilia bacterium]|nr:hypothetical protein [Thermoleophilia bacterium]
MSTRDRTTSFASARSQGDDWLVDGRPVVADGIEPDATIEVDRFECIACGRALDVLVGMADDDAVTLEDATWTEAGFRTLESVPGRPPLHVDVHGLQAVTRVVTCAECGTEQVAIAAGGEWQPQRYVIVAHGTAPAPVSGTRASTWIAVAVVALVVVVLAVANAYAVRDYWAAHVDARDGRAIDGWLLAAHESGGGPRMIASHSLTVAWTSPGDDGRELEVDEATWIRYADAETVPLHVRGDRATVVGDHAQRNDLVAMLAIDAAILLTILGIVISVRMSAREARREPRA